jgi:hypothetical protein
VIFIDDDPKNISDKNIRSKKYNEHFFRLKTRNGLFHEDNKETLKEVKVKLEMPDSTCGACTLALYQSNKRIYIDFDWTLSASHCYHLLHPSEAWGMKTKVLATKIPTNSVKARVLKNAKTLAACLCDACWANNFGLRATSEPVTND